MKLLLKILIPVLVFYLCYTLLAQVRTPGKTGDPVTPAEVKKSTSTDQETLDLPGYDRSEGEEEDLLSYDQDYLTRKLFQKKLPPLTRKETIIWSFRMAETNTFL